ncbi:MAG: HIT family protein [Chitinophagaceae bacterium]
MTIFSKIIAGDIPSYKIAESELFFAFLDIDPLQKGHTLVVPKVEIDKVFDLPSNYLAEMLVFAQPIAKAIETCFPCNRISMVTVGLEVPHAHLQLNPINEAKYIHIGQPKLSLTTEEFKAIQASILQHL